MRLQHAYSLGTTHRLKLEVAPLQHHERCFAIPCMSANALGQIAWAHLLRLEARPAQHSPQIGDDGRLVCDNTFVRLSLSLNAGSVYGQGPCQSICQQSVPTATENLLERRIMLYRASALRSDSLYLLASCFTLRCSNSERPRVNCHEQM